MENQSNGENIQGYKAPRLEFTFAGTGFSLAEVFSVDPQKRKINWNTPITRELTLGEDAANTLLHDLEGTGLTIDQYLRAMPRLFEYIRSEEDYDTAFIGNVYRIFDETAKKMAMRQQWKDCFKPVQWKGYSNPETFFARTAKRMGFRQDQENQSSHWPGLDEKAREMFFARAYGYIECLYEEIWNAPTKYEPARFDLTRRQRRAELRQTGLNYTPIKSILQGYP